LFEDATIRRLCGHFQTLLSGIARNPEQRISELPILSWYEVRQLLQDWNRTERRYLNELCLHELFEQQVERTAEAVALVFEDEHLSYTELNQQANRLAHYLRSKGVGAESLVGVFMQRSIEQVVSLLAVLKAGAAYVPLDPQYPDERLGYLLEDAAVRVVITHQHLKSRLSLSVSNVICADVPLPNTITSDLSSAKIPRSGGGEDILAYVINPSGTTGRRKGVKITHRGI